VDQDDDRIELAVRDWDWNHSPEALVREVLAVIRGPETIDRILSRLPSSARPRVVRELREEYGPHVDLSDESEQAWGMAAGAFTDPEEHRRRHAAFVQHAVRVAIPAIRTWLAAHADEQHD
jgi:hypothetical protein